MAFWNRKRKKKKEEELTASGEGQQEPGRVLSEEEEAAELFGEIESDQKSFENRRNVRKERRKRKRIRAEEEKKEALRKADAELYKTETLHPTSKADRQRYVIECCENIREVDHQIENIRGEYKGVTDSLLDIQKIDRIPPTDRAVLRNVAGNIVKLLQERSRYKNRNLNVSEAVIRRFEPYEDDLVDEIKKMYEAENYQKLLDKDLDLLHQEKKDLRADKVEIIEKQNSLKWLAKGLIIIILSLFALFLVLSYAMEIDVTFPYLATILLAAISSTVIFMESMKNRKDMSLTERKLSKAISYLNKVKIKCVNNLNLLEYNREKFGVEDAKMFEAYWTEYCKVREYERRYKENTERLGLYNKDLLELLKAYGVSDTEIWLSQTQALVDDREMVEIRHELNSRRQLLRERIEYNEGIKSSLVGNVDTVIKENPEEKEGLLEIVQRFS